MKTNYIDKNNAKMYKSVVIYHTNICSVDIEAI